MIPGAEPEVSPYIGAIVHRNLESVTELMHRIAKQSDLLAIVGDLYDHSRNLDPLSTTVKTTGDLWQALDYKPKDPYDKYPRDIDGLLLLSRILDIYQSGTPVVYVAGNHEAYQNPFGISPRVMRKEDKEMTRANAGVAADHNLTFYEAVLLYGPGSSQTGMEANLDKAKEEAVKEAKKEGIKAATYAAPKAPLLTAVGIGVAAANAENIRHGIEKTIDGIPKDTFYDTTKDPASPALQLNFRKENFDWLYCLYSPWKDFVISCGSPRTPAKTDGPAAPGGKSDGAAQPPPAAGRTNFIGLGWGDDEDFLTTTAYGTGSLPRAPGACTPEQVELTDWAVNFSEADRNILLTHFTFVSYDQDRPFNDSKAKLDLNDGKSDSTVSAFAGDHFASSRPGHSPYDIGSFYKNRKKMYELLRDDKLNYAISGHSHRAGMYPCPSVSGELKPLATVGDRGGVKIGTNKVLVCGSSGPFSYRNLTGELAGLGMDFPQGFILDAGRDEMRYIKDKRVKPRLAVVLDYLWYEGNCPAFVEAYNLRNESTLSYALTADHCFCFLSSQKFKRIFQGSHPFREITLVAMVKDEDEKDQDGQDDQKDQIQFAYLPMTVIDREIQHPTLYPPTAITITATYTNSSWKTFNDKVGDPKKVLQHFLSITFRDVPDVDVTAANYELGIPWCFPVEVDKDSNGN